jgi:hypothetical protein
MVGDPEKCIGLAAREHAVDLVIVARANGTLPAAYGNDLGGILRKLACPLLTIPVDAVATMPAMDKERARQWGTKVAAGLRR